MKPLTKAPQYAGAARPAARLSSTDTPGSPADRPDALELYRWAVQDPETHATVLRLMFERLHPGHQPRVLREDFAGTSAEAVAWLALGAERQAVAVDRDAQTLAWARRRARRLLGPRAEQLRFVEADVMSVAPPVVPAADIVSVLNFSVLYLHDAAQLQTYLRHAWHCLASPGLLVLNLFGGRGALQPRIDTHRVTPRPRLMGEVAVPPFDYLWEQRAADPVTRRLDCRIHFRLPDPTGRSTGLQWRDAFRYDWRLWSLGELDAALREAGFSAVQVWRHTYDPTRGAQGVFLGAVDPADLEGLDLWTAYVVAVRGPAPAA
jgi:SAM-dependent methyltransferase